MKANIFTKEYEQHLKYIQDWNKRREINEQKAVEKFWKLKELLTSKKNKQ